MYLRDSFHGHTERARRSRTPGLLGASVMRQGGEGGVHYGTEALHGCHGHLQHTWVEVTCHVMTYSCHVTCM